MAILDTPIHLFHTAIRGTDSYGSGEFGASRGYTLKGIHKLHLGVDLVVSPGDAIKAPCRAKVRAGQCYKDTDFYRLLKLDSTEYPLTVWVLYIAPYFKTGEIVEEGQTIGLAQDLQQRYPADKDHEGPITNHIHVQVGVVPDGYLVHPGVHQKRVVWIDPALVMRMPIWSP